MEIHAVQNWNIGIIIPVLIPSYIQTALKKIESNLIRGINGKNKADEPNETKLSLNKLIDSWI